MAQAGQCERLPGWAAGFSSAGDRVVGSLVKAFVHSRRERGRLMKVGLEVLTAGKSEGKVIPITLSQFVIGRDPQCHLRPASALISKRHCAVIQRDGKAFIRDFGSTNGTFVNDEPVQGERELNHGD